jgi:hypothetical protein
VSVSKPSRNASVRAAKYSGQHTFSIDVDLAGADAMLDGLAGDIEAAARPAAQAAAEVLYQAVIKNVQAIGSVTGNLRNAIYQAFSPDQSAEGKAVYHVSWRTSGSGGPRAPHGHLVEFGHLQRYASYIGSDGHWYTAVRPEMRGKPRPRRNASQAEKDAYYVLRKGGPIQIPARPFIRPVVYQAGGAAAEAAKAKLFDVLGAK